MSKPLAVTRRLGSRPWSHRTFPAAAVFLAWALAASPAVAQDPHAAGAAEEEAVSGNEARLLSGIRQVTFEGRRAGEGYFSADGSSLVFQSERDPENPFFQIYLLDLDTGDVRKVSPGTGKTTCAWIHPSGERVLFASTHEDPDAVAKQREELELRASGKERRYSWDYDEHFEIYEHDLSTGELRNLTNARGYDAEGSWSPDGTLIAFASNRHAYTEELTPEDAERFRIDQAYLMDIYIMRADGSEVRRLTDVKGYDGGPFFSPDGSRICWRRFSEDGATAEVHTMRTDGSDVRRITRLGAMSWAPFYHPSGDYLVFTTNRHGFANFELYIVDTDGAREPVRVTDTAGFDGLPVFTPDGGGLYWTTNRTSEGQSQIFAARWNDAVARELLAAATPAEGAATDRAEEGPTAGSPSAPVPVEVARAAAAPTRPEISTRDLAMHVELLASEELEGRLTGTRGEMLATEYVARRFGAVGLEPAGDRGTWFQEFTFTAGVDLGPANRLAIRLEGEEQPAGEDPAIDEDWRPLAFSATGSFEAAELVFAGYGILAPEAEGQAEYDSFVHLDVTDRWVMVLRFLPENVEPERRQHLARYGSLRHKAMILRDRGARGVVVVSGPRSKVKDPLVRLGFDATLAGTSLPVISVTDELAARMLSAADKDLESLQESLDTGEPVMGFAVPGLRLEAEIDLRKVRKTGRNVLGRLPAGPEASGRPVVIVGAHVDHLGRGSSGSLARDGEKGEIHFGADDNASGVAATIEIAEYLVDLRRGGKLPLARDVVFAAWSGEELGLLGSRHFVDALSTELGDPETLSGAVAACLNLDMVGRLDKALVLQGVGSSTIWKREIERRNAPIGLPIRLSDDSYLPTDATSFYLRGVPILSAFTGSHSEYHTPRDTTDLIDYEGLQRIARFVALITRGLAVDESTPDWVAQKKPENQPRAGLRAYLGTIPDYAEGSTPGLVLSGVATGGPADQAGVKAGDTIVELAGRKVENIYDYTYAIEALKIGEATKVVVVREGERIELEITPSSRE